MFISERFRSFRSTRWNSNRYIRGSYSYTSVNCDHEQNFMSNLTETLVCNQYDKLGEESRKKTQSQPQSTPTAGGMRAGSTGTSTSTPSGHSTSSSNSSNTLTNVQPNSTQRGSNTPTKVTTVQMAADSLATTASNRPPSTPAGTPAKTKPPVAGSANVSGSVKPSATIHFAGEACHERYFSTVHGAYLSGMEQAKKILLLDQQQ